jgi:uncharacterized delta-60 repeat protein
LEDRTLLSPGDLDPTFGQGGLVTTSFPDVSLVNSSAQSVAVQPDGRLVVAGHTGRDYRSYRIGLARYNSDGILDSSFGTGGLVVTYLPVGPNSATIDNVLLQTDGRILVVGYDIIDPGSKYPAIRGVLARYNSDGSPDLSFGGTGVVVTTRSPGQSLGSSVAALQSDGRILVAVQDSSNLAVARYNSDGGVDSSFGTAGLATTSFADFPRAYTTNLALQPDGDIVVAGDAYTSSTALVALTRFHPDGSVDTSFGVGGRVATAFPDTPVQAVNSVAVQADGRILVAGSASSSSEDLFALARYDSNGSVDSSFGTGGLATTSFGIRYEGAHSLALQPNGRIVAVGYLYGNDGTRPPFALARYDADGSLDDSFGDGGQVTTDVGIAGGASAAGVAIQPDGRIVVVGSAVPDNFVRFALARYEGDPVGATRFRIDAPAEVTAGQQFDVTVSAVDDNGDVVPDYAGTVTLSSTDPLAPTLGSHTFTTADGGMYTFSAVQLFTAGLQSLVADDGTLSGQADLTVDPGLAVALLLSGPDQVNAGVPFVVTLTAYDAYGNVATGYRGSVSFVSTDPAAQLPVDYVFSSDDAGSHDFMITLNSPGPVRLTAIDTFALTLSYLDLTVN